MREDGHWVVNVLGKLPGKGGILLYDDMEGVLKWERVDGLTPASVWRRNLAAYQGDYGISLNTSIRFLDGWGWAYAGRSLGLRGYKRLQVVVVFRRRLASPSPGWRIFFRQYGSTVSYWASFSGTFGVGDDSWHQLQAVCDFETGKYGPCYLDGAGLGKEGLAIPTYPIIKPEVTLVILGCSAEIPRVIRGVDYGLVLVRDV